LRRGELHGGGRGEAEHGKCKRRRVSFHGAVEHCLRGAMLYVTRVVALPIVCQRTLRAAALLLCLAACARTGLYPGELREGDTGDSGGSTSSGGVGVGAVAQPIPTNVAPSAGAANAPFEQPRLCDPRPEACNGSDDDCNGAVDDLPAEACAGGGFRFCVAGRLSECPKRCEVCVPGSVRICQNPFCTFWGEQECAADGQGFGNCREANPPPECAAIARKYQESRELEQCCIDNGYCCLDEHDVDRDGNRGEMLGACGDIACQ
jgi:hypothetical protein